MRSIGLVFLVCLVSGCSTLRSSAGGGSSLRGPVLLAFKGKPGEVTETRYSSNSQVRSYESGQILRDRSEGVDFVVASTVTSFSEKEGLLKLVAKTVSKDGTIELHDLAFPELREEIDYVLQTNGKVLKAGSFPPNSLFFVPALPMPARAVDVGDTWTMEHTWASARDGIPLRLETVAILKNIVSCGGGSDHCADLEISGRVGLVLKATNPGSQFKSRVWGRVLFSIGRGDVVWSEMRSSEDVVVADTRLAVRSCMVSEIKTSAPFKTKFECDPSVEAVAPPPKF